MEQTLGKRIVHHRKKLGLTQDQLAEQLGVTAQAVSKWENDQSCPDITMLPKLAAIFGITTDALLGSTPAEPVTATHVTVEDAWDDDDDEDDDEDGGGLHIHKGNWEFKWDGGRRGALTIALLVLAIGGQLLAARLLNRDIGFWSITWTSAFLIFGFMGFLRRFRFWELGAFLVGGYFVLDNWQVLPFTVGSELIFPLILLLFGLSLLLDAFRRPKKSRYSFKRKGTCGNIPSKHARDFSVEDGFLSYSGSFGDDRQEVVLPLLTGGEINTSFGDFTLDLSGVEAVGSPCRMEVNTSFGEATILVPKRFAVKAASSASFAEVSVVGHPDPDPQGIIAVEANASFGNIVIRYI